MNFEMFILRIIIPHSHQNFSCHAKKEVNENEIPGNERTMSGKMHSKHYI